MKASIRLLALMALGLALAGCAGSRGALEQHTTIRYTAIGASDAIGIGATPPTDGYVFRIVDALEAEGRRVELVNLGIAGANIDPIEDAVRLSLEAGRYPHLVTIWVGANDLIDGVSPSIFEAELDDMLRELRKRDEAFIAIANLPDLTKLPRFRERPSRTVTVDRIEEFNEVIEDLADDYDATLVDLSSEPVDANLVSPADGFHPNDAGHERLARKFLEVILPELR